MTSKHAEIVDKTFIMLRAKLEKSRIARIIADDRIHQTKPNIISETTIDEQMDVDRENLNEEMSGETILQPTTNDVQKSSNESLLTPAIEKEKSVQKYPIEVKSGSDGKKCLKLKLILKKGLKNQEENISELRPKIPLLKIKVSEVLKKNRQKRLRKKEKKKQKKLEKLKRKAENELRLKKQVSAPICSIKELADISQVSSQIDIRPCPSIHETTEGKLSSSHPAINQLTSRQVAAIKPQIENAHRNDLIKLANLDECFVRLTRCDGITSKSSEVNTRANIDKLTAETSDCEDVEMVLLEEIKKEKSDDVEMVDQSKCSVFKPSSTKPPVVKRKGVANLFWFKAMNNEAMLECTLCGLITKSHEKFRQHIELKHGNFHWSGYCYLCNQQGDSAPKPLLDELYHLVKHIDKDFHSSEKKNMTKIKQAAKPLTKLPMISIPKHLLPTSEIQDDSAKTSLKVLLDSISTMKRLRPWLSPKTAKPQKFLSVCHEMMSVECLSALFKCMGVGCSYYTSDQSMFEKHLNSHHEFQVDDKNFSFCSYCDFESPKVGELIEHIVKEHGSDRFQCKQCFYRSYGSQIFEHYSIFHKHRANEIIECTPVVIKDEALEVQEIWNNCTSYVPAMTCMGNFFCSYFILLI